MSELDFDVHFGPVSNKKINWRDVLTADEPDDDEELDVTPDDVIGLLGFDPKEFSEEVQEKFIGLDLIFKVGTARSGNRGHSGRPGQVGGSGSGGGSETNSLFAKTDQEIRDIETKQGTLNKDVFQRQLDVKDFMPGGKYEKITRDHLAIDGLPSSRLNELLQEDPDIVKDMVEGNNTASAKGENGSGLLSKVNKFDSQNALYDKLKDNKDFNELADSSFQPFDRGKNLYTWSHGLDENQYNEEVKRKTIRDLVDQWASTSGDTDPKAVAMQIAAQELFGEGKTDHMTNQIALNTTLGPELKFNPGRKAFLQAQYDATQDYLKKNNIKEMIVYRGHEGWRSKLEGGNDVEVNLQPLSSFSMSANVAVGFAVAAAMGQYATTKPSVIISVVPAKKIFALPNTGIGCTGEKEVVVLGGKTKSTVVAGHLKIGDAFGNNQDALNPQTLSAVDFKRNLTPKDTSSYPALNSLLEGKAPKKDIPNLDEDLENADWTKRTWDLPKYGSKEFDEFIAASGMTLSKFKELPVYRWMIESGLKVGKSIGLSGMFQKRSR